MSIFLITHSQTIDGQVLRDHDVSAPHSTHCLANGNVMISTMGDAQDKAKGDFILFDQQFDCVGTWVKGDEKPAFGYDFWYQPKFNVMVSSEWSAPEAFKRYVEIRIADLANNHN